MNFLWEPQHVYNDYFDSEAYSGRYPTCNHRSLEMILKYAQSASTILDFGCGEGRYTLPLLQYTTAQITAYDVSDVGIVRLQERLTAHNTSWNQRVTVVEGSISQVQTAEFDVILAMFGVLSHISGRKNRIETLHILRQLLRPPHGVLIVSVPNAQRRFFREQIQSTITCLLNPKFASSSEQGDIDFIRRFRNQKEHQMYYHLYTVQSLQQEFQEAGLIIERITAESILPEWLITRHSLLGKLDQTISSACPASLGYGILAVALPLVP